MYMESKWANKKQLAIQLRRRGISIRTIETRLGIPRSTLSGWFHVVPLTFQQEVRLQQKMLRSLAHARISARRWHRAQKQLRLKDAMENAKFVLTQIAMNKNIIKIALASLYMGEGAKRDGNLVLANSNPVIVRFYINALHLAYDVPKERLKIELHIRADQNGEALMRYWLRTLQLPKSAAGSIQVDARTKIHPTRPKYKGVCLVSGGGSAAQRELIYLGNTLFKHIEKLA